MRNEAEARAREAPHDDRKPAAVSAAGFLVVIYACSGVELEVLAVGLELGSRDIVERDRLTLADMDYSIAVDVLGTGQHLGDIGELRGRQADEIMPAVADTEVSDDVLAELRLEEERLVLKT